MKRFGLVVTTAIALVLTSGGVARAQGTATGRYAACREDAFWDAYDCFMASKSYWGDVWCNEKWDFNNTACDVKLAKEVLPD